VDVLKRTPLYLHDIWDNNSIDDDADGNAIFDLSPAFIEMNTEPSPDHFIIVGDYQISWWVNADPAGEHEIPNRWQSAGGDIVVSKNVIVTVCRTGGDPSSDAQMRVEFVKYWAMDN